VLLQALPRPAVVAGYRGSERLAGLDVLGGGVVGHGNRDDDVSKPTQNASEGSTPPEVAQDTFVRAGKLGPADAVRLRQTAVERRQQAIRLAADGDRIGAKVESDMADRFAQAAALALDPVLHTTGRVAVGNGGELAIGTQAMQPFVDTVRAEPDMVVADASRQRMELANEAGAFLLGLDAAMTIKAGNSLEKMLMHQAAAAHVAAMDLQAEARELRRAYKRTGYNHHSLSVEAGRMVNASARMMDTYQRALLTLERLRNGGKQTVVVQHVTVADGGQAVVAGQVKPGPKQHRVRNGGG